MLDLNFNDGPIILDLCGGSGSWSQPYADAGYDVRVVTLPYQDVRMWPSTPSAIARLPQHFADVRTVGSVRGVLAAPPCTVFSNAGNHVPRTDDEILEGLSVVDACIRLVYVLKPAWWALENPLGKLNKWLGDPVFSFDPCDFGDPYTKRTHLWGSFNPPKLNVVTPVHGSMMYKFVRDPAKRAITPRGFANAFFEANP